MEGLFVVRMEPEDLYEPGLEPLSGSEESEGELFVDEEVLRKEAIDPDALEPIGAPDGEGENRFFYFFLFFFFLFFN